MTTTTRAALGIGKPRRIRSDAKLTRLSAAQRERLRAWLDDENRTYAEVVVRLREECGLSVGKSALSVYYRRHVLPEQEDVDTQAARFLAALPEGELSPAILHRAKALAFSALCRPQPLIRLATRLRDVVYRSEKRRLARARLALAERRAVLRANLAARKLHQLRSSNSELRSPIAPSPSQKTPQNPPRFPGYPGLTRPSKPTLAPLATTCPQDPKPLPQAPILLPQFILSVSSASTPSLPPKIPTKLPSISGLSQHQPAHPPSHSPISDLRSWIAAQRS